MKSWLRLLGNTQKEQHNNQGMYTNNVECRCQHCKNPSGSKRESDKVLMESIQSAIQTKEETKRKIHAARGDVKQSNKKGKTTNQVKFSYDSGLHCVVVLRRRDHQETTSKERYEFLQSLCPQ
jgi:hypothetical protein